MATKRRNKATIAPTTTNPAKMGEEMAYPSSVAAQSPNVKYQARGGATGGSIPREKGAPGRANVQTNDNSVPQSPERLGAKWAPQMLMHSPDAAVGSAETQRNVRTLPSAVGSRDFWYKRQYGQGLQ